MMLSILMVQVAPLTEAEVVRIPFAPPLDVPVIEESIQTRELDSGGEGRFIVRREYRFSRDGDGYLVVMRAMSADSDVTGPAKTGFEIAARPMIGLPLRVRLDRDGRVLEVLDGETYWAAFTAGQMALRRELEGRGGLASTDRRIIAAVVDGILAVPPPAREARLRGDVEGLTALAGRTLPIDSPIEFAAVGSQAGGALRVASVTQDAVELTLVAATGEGAVLARIDTSERITVDRATGMMRSRVRSRVTRQGYYLGRSNDERRLIRP